MLTSPAPGTVLPGSPVTFSWAPSSSSTAYSLSLGTTGTGSSNLYSSGTTTATSVAVNIPSSGVTVYARLATDIGGVWEHYDYTFTESGEAVPAVLTAPAPGSQLSGSSATFSWTPGVGVTSYELFVGTTGSGSSSIFSSGATSSTSLTVGGLPANGATVYVRLSSLIDGAWQAEDFTVMAAGTPGPVTLISPAPGSQFAGSSVNFAWTSGGATAYKLYLGTTGSASSNLYSSGMTTATSISVSGLPENGVTVYARLSWEIGGTWQFADYTFTEAGTPQPATLTSPAPGSQLGGASATFSWTPGVGATVYNLILGTSGAGSTNLFSSGSTTATSVTVPGLPANGVIIYARLSSSIGANWEPVDYTFIEAGTPSPAAMISPAPGSQLSGSSATFTWTPGTGATEYMLYLGSNGAGSSNLFNSGGVTSTSVTVGGLPVNGAPIYAKLSSLINGSWEFATYTFAAAPAQPALSSIACSSASLTGSASDACTVSVASPAPSGGTAVSLASSNGAVIVPSSVTVAAGATSATFTASASPVATAQTATVTAAEGGASMTFALQLNAFNPVLSLSASNLAFGNVTVNSSATQTLTLSSTGNAPVTVNSLTLAGVGFQMPGLPLPITLNPGQTAAVTMAFNPAAAGAASGTLTVASNSTSNGSAAVSLAGTGMAMLSAFSCGTSSFTGSGSDSCSVTLNVAAPTGGASVTLSSSSSAVTVPASVTVAAGTTSAAFTAAVSSVSSAQTAALTASEGGSSMTSAVQLIGANAALGLSTTSVSFGSTPVNTPVSQTVTLSSTGNVAVTVSSTTLSGTGFTMSGGSFPMTLNPNQTATITLQFDPAAAGAASGTLTVASNSTSNGSAAVSLTGTGMAMLSAFSCGTSSFTGSGSDSCSVTLDVAAPTGGASVALSSSSSSVTVPASVTVAAGATSAAFTATVSSVSTTQTATLTASEGGSSATFPVQLNAAVPTLSLSASTMGFGSIPLNTPTTQSITLTSTGTASVTVSSAAVSGAGFSLAATTVPVTLASGQTATLEVEFDPSAAGAATGALTIGSNSSTGATVTVSLTGTGTQPVYQASLSWAAPSSPSDPIAGYNVYRAASGGTLYQQLNSSVTNETTYTDTTVQNGVSYDYYVESVDGSGVTSVPSTTVALAIP